MFFTRRGRVFLEVEKASRGSKKLEQKKRGNDISSIKFLAKKFLGKRSSRPKNLEIFYEEFPRYISSRGFCSSKVFFYPRDSIFDIKEFDLK